tara:strand:- start:4641 stop:5081 length:441 start_codon:yes stop_codon:yes gene_type:complete
MKFAIHNFSLDKTKRLENIGKVFIKSIFNFDIISLEDICSEGFFCRLFSNVFPEYLSFISNTEYLDIALKKIKQKIIFDNLQIINIARNGSTVYSTLTIDFIDRKTSIRHNEEVLVVLTFIQNKIVRAFTFMNSSSNCLKMLLNSL